MAVTFPSSPTTNQQVTDSVTGAVWQWDTTKWVAVTNATNFAPLTNPAAGQNNYAPVTGVTDGSNAATGQVGEFVSATGTTLPGAAAAPANMASVSLTAGDWEIWGQFMYTANGTGVSATSLRVSISTTSAAYPTGANANVPGDYQQSQVPTMSGASYNWTFSTGVARVNSATAFTAYLVAGWQTAGTLSGPTSANAIYARRVR